MTIFYEIWRQLQIAGPYLLFGFFAAGLVNTFISAGRIASLLGERNWKSVFWASLVGVPLPLCSCSVIPTAAALRQKGASRGATASFLISTPETGVDSIALTYGVMDLTIAILRPVVSFLTALAAGMIVNRWGEHDEAAPAIESSCPRCQTQKNAAPAAPANGVAILETANRHSWLYKIFRFAYIDLSNDLAYWLALGFVLSGVIGAWLPPMIFEGWAGQGFSSLILMLVIGVPMYICASASTPIAAAMIAKGLSPGAAMVFLLAGPATNIGAIPVISKIIGRRSMILYLISIVFFSLCAGELVNLFYSAMKISPSMGINHVHAEEQTAWSVLWGAALGFLIVKGVWNRPMPKEWKSVMGAVRKPFGVKSS
ncbi:MAG: SO_0444 family Cu/Zn efflux transporter [Candidatus Omnitrophota bacterium]